MQYFVGFRTEKVRNPKETNTVWFGFIVLILVSAAEGICTTSTTWVSVPEANYDQNYSPIDNTQARPLGFKAGRYVYSTKQSVCVGVKGTEGRMVEVKVEADPATTLCLQSGEDSLCTQADGKLSLCQKFAGDNNVTTFEFFCNSQCAEGDVTFWYRFTVSPGASSDADEIWCRERNSQFPGDLLRLSWIPSTQGTVADKTDSAFRPLLHVTLLYICPMMWIVLFC